MLPVSPVIITLFSIVSLIRNKTKSLKVDQNLQEMVEHLAKKSHIQLNSHCQISLFSS